MRFSDHFSVGQPADADWFDLNVLMDTPLYVDPFLVFDENGEENVWTGAHEEIVDFFAAALDLVKKADGHENSMHWAKAVRFLQFPEPKEFALGLSMGHPEGAGISPDLALDICRGLDLFRSGGATPTTDSLEWSRLSCTDWGWIASATWCATSSNTASWVHAGHLSRAGDSCRGRDAEQQRLDRPGQPLKHARVPLPKSPDFDGAILLAPKRFLKDIPRVTAEGFWTWATQK